MSRRGNCWDNAVAESFFASLKNQEADGVYESKHQAYQPAAAFTHGSYNPNRLHSSRVFFSPNDCAAKLKAAVCRDRFIDEVVKVMRALRLDASRGRLSLVDALYESGTSRHDTASYTAQVLLGICESLHDPRPR